MAKIYIIRHGETIWNKEQRSQGKSNNIELSKKGIEQAKAIGEKLKNYDIDLFYSSSLIRALKTAQIIADYHSKEVICCEEFMEINFGCWEGLCFNQIKYDYPEIYNIWKSTPDKACIPMAESLVALKERSMKKLYEILYNNPNRNILIVSHGITIKTMIASIIGMDLSNLHKIRQDNTSLNIFNYDDNRFEIITLNDICHLEGNDLCKLSL